MKKQQTKQHDISALAGLLLLGIFAVCILSVLLTGANAYRRLTRRDDAALEMRTRIQYVATKLRQAPAGVRIEPFGDGDALLLPEEIDGEAYLTRIYCHDGWLMELFSADDGISAPEDGEKLIAAKALTLDADGGLITVRVTGPEDDTETLSLSLRCGEEGAP